MVYLNILKKVIYLLLFSAYFEKTLDSTEHLVLFVVPKDFAALNLLS